MPSKARQEPPRAPAKSRASHGRSHTTTSARSGGWVQVLPPASQHSSAWRPFRSRPPHLPSQCPSACHLECSTTSRIDLAILRFLTGAELLARLSPSSQASAAAVLAVAFWPDYTRITATSASSAPSGWHRPVGSRRCRTPISHQRACF